MRRSLAMSKFVYSSILALVCSPAVWAGPSMPAMAQADAEAPRVADIASAEAVALAETSLDRPVEYASGATIDAADISPADPHPMIPLPPAVWAGFIGLAYVVRRVTRGRAA